jgi:hypothetical protein
MHYERTGTVWCAENTPWYGLFASGTIRNSIDKNLGNRAPCQFERRCCVVTIAFATTSAC